MTRNKVPSRGQVSVEIPKYDPDHNKIRGNSDGTMISPAKPAEGPSSNLTEIHSPDRRNLEVPMSTIKSRSNRTKAILQTKQSRRAAHTAAVEKARADRLAKTITKHRILEAEKQAREKRLKDLERFGINAAEPCKGCVRGNLVCLILPPDYKPATKRPGRRCVFCFDKKVNCVTNHKSFLSCDECLVRKINCVPRPPKNNTLEYKNRQGHGGPRSCLKCSKAGQKCEMPEPTASSITTSTTIQRSWKRPARRVYPAHTIQWYKILSKHEQLKYKSEQIQADGVLRAEGPCTRCVLLGVQCMVVRPGSLIFEFTQPKRCASCLLPQSKDSQVVGKSCDTAHGTSHDDYNPKWGPGTASGASFTPSKPSSTVTTNDTQPNDLDTPLSDSRTLTPSFATVSSSTKMYSHRLEANRISEHLQKLDHLVKSLCQRLVFASNKVNTPRPLRSDNLDALENSDRQIQKNSSGVDTTTVLKAIQHLLGVTEVSGLRNAVRRLHLQDLDFPEVFQAAISMMLLELVFSKPPSDVQTFRDTLKRAFNPTGDLLNRVVEDYFGRLLQFPLGEAVKSHILEDLATQLFRAITPLAKLLFNECEVPPHLKENFRRDCALIVKSASLLHTELHAKPTNPVAVYFIQAGEPLDCYYVEGQPKPGDQVALTLMFGVKAALEPGRPFVYCRAKAMTCTSRN